MVSKTIELRKVIQSILETTQKNVFYENADKNSNYPYIVYELESVNFGYTHRNDVILTIDIWDKNSDSTRIETLADDVEMLLDFNNCPNNNVLPTFYVDYRASISDEDKNIRRRQIKATIQNYYIGG